MKFMRQLLAGISMLTVCGTVQAAPVGKALILIEPEYYAYEVKLWHFYYDYWFRQGEALEPVALETLKPLFADVGTCKTNEAADVIVWLKPRMFYNPHMTTFYATVDAQVFSGSGKLLGAYVAKTRHQGFLDVAPARQVQVAYRLAMQDIIRQMQPNEYVQTLREQGLPANETHSPCSIVSVLPPTK